MAKVRIKQTRSMIGRPEKQVRTLKALGLGKINREVEHDYTPQIQGMVVKINHLVEVTEL